MTRGNKSSGGRQSTAAAAAAAAGSRHAAPVVSVISINFHVPSVLHMCNVLEASLLLLLLHVVALCRRQDHAHARRATTCRMHEQKAVEEELAACDVEPGSIDRPNPFFLFLTEARLTTASPIFECVCAVVFLRGPVQSTPAAPSYCIHYTPHHRVCDRRRRRCPRPARPSCPPNRLQPAAPAAHSPCILHSQCGRSRRCRTRTWSSIPSTEEARSDLRTRFTCSFLPSRIYSASYIRNAIVPFLKKKVPERMCE